MKKVNYLVALLLFVSTAIFAGGPESAAWAWGDKEVEAKGTWLNMEKLVKQHQYNDASSEIKWLLSNTPNLNVALYINAIKVYEKREKAEKDLTRKIQMQDSTLMLYDKRIELFGDEANVLNRKGKVAWDYLSKRKGTSGELYALYSKIYELNKAKTYSENMSDYMKAACTQYLNKKMTKTEIISVYNNCNEVFDAQSAKTTNAKKIDKIERYRGLTTQIFSKNVDINCEDIQNEFGGKFNEKPDVKMAKLIIGLSVSKKCLSNDVFIAAASFLSEKEQSNYALEKILANIHSKNGENEKAIVSFNKALKLTEDSAKIGELYLEIAELNAKDKNFGEARTNALKAVQMNKSLTKSYSLIGDLYFQSSSTCSTGNKVQDRAAYIAAYNMYIKAGNSAKAQEAKAQFPSMEEMFLYNQKPGDVVNTGCWIGESVKLDKR